MTENTAPHLRSVPGPEEAAGHDVSGISGLTPPSGVGRSARFVTDVLRELGYVSADRVEAAVAEGRISGKPPEHVLLEQNAIDPSQLSHAIAERYGLDHVDLSLVPRRHGGRQPAALTSARRYRAVPIGYADPQTLLVAMADPANVLAADDIKMATGLRCRLVVADAADIDSLIGRLNSLQSAVTEAAEDDAREADEQDLDSVSGLHASAEDAPVVKLVY